MPGKNERQGQSANIFLFQEGSLHEYQVMSNEVKVSVDEREAMECGESSPLCFLKTQSGEDSPHSIGCRRF
jgi:hypothetical protein